MTEEIIKEISDCIVRLDIDRIENLVKRALESSTPAYKVVSDGMSKGVDNVCHKFQTGEFSTFELVIASKVVKQGMAQLEPRLKEEGAKPLGKVVIGEAKGATTGGREIVANLLTGSGFEVHDLGTDIGEDKFIEKVKEVNADIVAISVLVTSAAAEIKNVVEALKKAGLRKKIKFIIGGQKAASNKFATEFGADAVAEDVCDGIRICKEWVKGKPDIS